MVKKFLKNKKECFGGKGEILSKFLSKDTAASRNEKVFIAVWGIGSILVERGVRCLL